MKAYTVWVCKGPDCTQRGSDDVARVIAEDVRARALAARCRVLRGGCFGRCATGVNVVVREYQQSVGPRLGEDRMVFGAPGEFLYCETTVERAQHIVREHLEQDMPYQIGLSKKG